MERFDKRFPQTAAQLRAKGQARMTQRPLNTFSHWVLLGLFALMLTLSLPKLGLLLGTFTLLTALVKGPLMLIYGAIYTFLVSLFPPLGVVLSLVLLFLSLLELQKNWRFGLVAAYFYLVPLFLAIWQPAGKWAFFGLKETICLALIIGAHYIINWLYKHSVASQSLCWSLISLPYDCLLFFLPMALKERLRIKKLPDGISRFGKRNIR